MDILTLEIVFNKLQKDYMRISELKDKTKDEYLYEFLHGKMDYIEILTDWIMIEQEIDQ